MRQNAALHRPTSVDYLGGIKCILGSRDVERSLQGVGEHIYGPIRTDRDPAFFVNTGARARFGARAEMTDTAHASGTDRIAEVARRLDWSADRVVVNVQGDEPLLPPVLVSQVAGLLDDDPEAGMATLATPIVDRAEWDDPNVVKVVTDQRSRALYFSRASIPWPRDGSGAAGDAMRHVGLYAYRVRALKEFTAAEPCGLELQERLEQLRALWLGISIRVARAREIPPRGVDTEDDLIAVRRVIAQRSV